MSATITANDIILVDTVRLQLLDCKTRQEIEDVFSRAKIVDFPAKTEFLYTAMQIRSISGIPSGKVPDPEDVYNYYVEFFLEGEWKEFV